MNLCDHNFFIFGSLFSHCYWECRDILELTNCQFINDARFTTNPLIWFAYKVHNAGVVNKLISLPGRSLWYRHFFDTKRISEERTNFFVFFDSNPHVYNPKFLNWLSHKPKACLVLFFDNSMSMRSFKDIEYFKKYFSQIYTTDKNDSEEFGFTYIEGLLSKKQIREMDKTCDVFFCGRNKGRERSIMQAYDILTSKGYNCNFTVVGATEQKAGINREPMSYGDMLDKVMASKCVLEICDPTQVAYTMRTLEAIIYDKLLITNNPLIENSPYFDNEKIFVFRNIEEIENLSFDFNKRVSYNYQGEFSPIKFLKRVIATYNTK